MRTLILAIIIAALWPIPSHATIDPGFTPCAEVKTCPGEWRSGQRGMHVVRLQLRLSEYGYPLRIDGIFGWRTAKAVTAFQRNKGMRGNGVVDAATREALNEPVRLRGGSEGEPVANLQQRLNRLGYGVLAVDGVLGPETQHALAAFQTANGLKANAMVDADTRVALESPKANHAPRDYVLEKWNRGFKVPIELVNALIRQESGGRTNVVSKAGALGKYQIMPGTARIWGPKCGYPWLAKAKYRDVRKALFNPSIAEDLARCYINYAHDRYAGDVALILASYNSGFGGADIAENCFRKTGRYCVLRETYGYIRSIMRMVGKKVPKLACRCRMRG